jgi:transposase
MCSMLPIKHVAEIYGLGWDAVKAIDKTTLERRLGPPDLDNVEVIAMDEFAIQKGHQYATVIVEPYRKRVLWLGRGRDREGVREFYKLLGPERCQRIKAAVMDMNSAFELELKANCPNAEVVFDLFHIIMKYGREVIDRVRVDEANRLRTDRKQRHIVKSTRWLLLRNRENIKKREDRVRLDELLRANRSLLKVYVLKDDLKHLWDFRSPGHALRFWKSWYSRAVRSRLPALKRFAKNLAARVHGILAHARWPLHTSLLEGINNRIKVIKRMAYGFRDDAYFFLKIRAAFPGTAG